MQGSSLFSGCYVAVSVRQMQRLPPYFDHQVRSTILSELRNFSLYLFSKESYANSKDWMIEHVQVLPLDEGQTIHSLSYLIHRTNFTNNLTSFILDLSLNRYFNSHVPIEYDHEERPRTTTNCSFYTGSIRHWGASKSMVAISVCSGVLVSVRTWKRRSDSKRNG